MTEHEPGFAQMWSYPENVGRIDVTGYVVEALDGEIGKVDEASLDPGSSYLVVDTGPWILGKKVLIPASLVERVERDDETVYVGRTKDEIEAAPEFDKERYRDADYRDGIGKYYETTSTRGETG